MKKLSILFGLAMFLTPTFLSADAGKLIWDSWYTVTVNGTIKYGYYSDRFEKKDKKIFFQNKFWKNEDGFINQEHLGAFALDNDDFSPDFYNFHATYRASETTIDGTVTDGKNFRVRTKQGEKELPVVTRTINSHIFFSGFFPLWLGKRLPTMKTGKTIPFTTVLEDSIDIGFANTPGWVRAEAPDDFAKKNKVLKLTVNHRGALSTWYVEKTGNPVRIDMGSRKTSVIRVSQAEAEKFLNP